MEKQWLIIESAGLAAEKIISRDKTFSNAASEMIYRYPGDEVDRLNVAIALERDGVITFDF